MVIHKIYHNNGSTIFALLQSCIQYPQIMQLTSAEMFYELILDFVTMKEGTADYGF